jgi:hypothetical protein
MSITANNVLKWSLIGAAYVFIVCIFSNSLDFDYGWHLRFGQAFFNSGRFPYLDSATWTHLGQIWVNHEWGGDILFWLVYSRLGYLPLLFLMALVPLAAFIIALRIFRPRINVTGAAVMLVSIWSIQHILTLRLAMFAPLFLAILWYCLEKLPRQKNYYLWPVIFWLWSALHGSWILGFIVIGIYIGGNIANLIAKKIMPRWHQTGLWSWKDIATAVLWSVISGLIICLNPYGTGLWREVLLYFTNPYFKSVIIEWIPSYTFPVYWQPLVIAAATVPFVIMGFLRKKITLPQMLLYFALWLAAWLYKRQAIIFVLIAAPLLAAVADIIIRHIPRRIILTAVYFALPTALLLSAGYLTAANFSQDGYNDRKLAERLNLPVGAAEFLRQESAGKAIYVFNEFSWGAYLDWTVPNALIFLDGRGTATWPYEKTKTLLKRYHEIIYEAGGFKALESGPAEYAILNYDLAGYPKPNLLNKIIFNKKDLAKIFTAEPPQLQKMLERSENWQIIYEDRISRVWKKLSSTSPRPSPW